MTEKPLVSVVIPTYNRRKKLKRLLDSVLKSDYKNIEVVVVDDASTDTTTRDYEKSLENVRLVRNHEERLLAGSRNNGILNSDGDLVFLIDDDNVLASDTISKLVGAVLDDQMIGVAGPVACYLTDASRVWCGRVKRNYMTSRTVFPERNTSYMKLNQSVLESDDFPNAFMVKREIVEKVGLFDERNFPIHYDEADFCKRVRDAGFTVVLVPSAQIWHDTPLPTGRVNAARRYSVHTPRRAFYAARNRILFHRQYSKWYEFLIFVSLFMPLSAAIYLKTILLDPSLVIGQRVKCARGYMKGILQGLQETFK
jgi:GT2 family glycosyltransferase